MPKGENWDFGDRVAMFIPRGPAKWLHDHAVLLTALIAVCSVISGAAWYVGYFN